MLRSICLGYLLSLCVGTSLVATEEPVRLKPRWGYEVGGVSEIARSEWKCGTQHPDQPRPAATRARAKGDLLFYRLEPDLVPVDYVGKIRFPDFTVYGDVRTIELNTRSTGQGERVTFDRVAVKTLGGEAVSVFEPELDAPSFPRSVAWDAAGEWWPNFAYYGPQGLEFVSVRWGPTQLPKIPVRRKGRHQYTSHVVNIVLPDYEKHWNDYTVYDLARAAKEFYRSFEDSYESLIFLSDAHDHLGEFTGLHQIVQSQLKGVGLGDSCCPEPYGSGGGLYGFNYTRDDWPHWKLIHEEVHQWASYFDWAGLAKIQNLGHQPSSHYPLLAGPGNFVNRLLSDRDHIQEVATAVASDGLLARRFFVAHKVPPVELHPLTLYAMGLLKPAEVGRTLVFRRQSQPLAIPGTRMKGGRKPVRVQDIVKLHGKRDGPVFEVFDSAFVVISKERISKELMSHLTVFAHRWEDPHRTGVLDRDGIGTFEHATGYRLDHRTDVRPLTGNKLKASFEADDRPFGRKDVFGIALDTPFEARHAAGSEILFSGRLSGEGEGAPRVTVTFLGIEPLDPGLVTFAYDVPVGADGTFSAILVLPGDASGPHRVRVELSASRGLLSTALSPVLIDG